MNYQSLQPREEVVSWWFSSFIVYQEVSLTCIVEVWSLGSKRFISFRHSYPQRIWSQEIPLTEGMDWKTLYPPVCVILVRRTQCDALVRAAMPHSFPAVKGVNPWWEVQGKREGGRLAPTEAKSFIYMNRQVYGTWLIFHKQIDIHWFHFITLHKF